MQLIAPKGDVAGLLAQEITSRPVKSGAFTSTVAFRCTERDKYQSRALNDMPMSGTRRNDAAAKTVARRTARIIQKKRSAKDEHDNNREGYRRCYFLTSQSGVCGRLLATHYSRTLRAGVNPPSEAAIMAHVSGYFRDCGSSNADERRVSGILRAGMGYWMRLLDMERGVGCSDVIDSAHSGYGFAIDAPIASSPLYSGAGEYFTTYGIVRGSEIPEGRFLAAISGGNMSNARDLEEDDVDLRRNKILKGRPRDATAKYAETHI